jgi:hypothetical protein
LVRDASAADIIEIDRTVGLVPLKAWVKTALDQVVQVHLKQADLEFVWVGDDAVCYSRTFRRSTQVETIDEGPGLDLTGYRFSKLPPGAVETRNGLKIAFIIPREKIQIASAKRIIETRLSSGGLSFELI